jgi:hypothetical protein
MNAHEDRQYYAAHAPAEVPRWFKVKPSRPQPAIPSCGHLTRNEYEEFENLRRGAIVESSASLRAIGHFREFNKVVEERQQWQDEQDEIEFFAWRWHYADMMISTARTAQAAA